MSLYFLREKNHFRGLYLTLKNFIVCDYYGTFMHSCYLTHYFFLTAPSSGTTTAAPVSSATVVTVAEVHSRGMPGEIICSSILWLGFNVMITGYF